MIKKGLDITGLNGVKTNKYKRIFKFLNNVLGSLGKLFVGMFSFKEINIFSESDFEKFDELLYQVENELLNLIR